MYTDELIGKIATEDIMFDEQINFDFVSNSEIK